MPLSAHNSPLVSGATFDLKQGHSGAMPGRLRALRAFCLAGERIEVDAIVSLNAATASELISAGKLVREPVPAPDPVKTPAPDVSDTAAAVASAPANPSPKAKKAD